MRYYLISENWLISRTARTVYRWSGGISFALLPTIVAIRLLGKLDLLTPGLDLVLRGVLMVCVLATSVTCIAMQYFLFTEDESSAWKQIFWFFSLMILGIGPGLCVFFGYSRSEYFKEEQARSASAGKQ